MNLAETRTHSPILNKPKEKKGRKPIKKVSKVRAALNKQYMKLRAEFLAAIPICQLCSCAPSTDVHHVKKRLNGNLNNIQTWKSLCRTCHMKIHQNPSWARSIGLLS